MPCFDFHDLSFPLGITVRNPEGSVNQLGNEYGIAQVKRILLSEVKSQHGDTLRQAFDFADVLRGSITPAFRLHRLEGNFDTGKAVAVGCDAAQYANSLVFGA